ncbi:hypothetical protein PC116_g10138 [Phytophthora cactorum]|nr:hypothetical protein PC116_g10138 [Phytophthora cactorum]
MLFSLLRLSALFYWVSVYLCQVVRYKSYGTLRSCKSIWYEGRERG